jgi:hypothetical protein
MAAYSDRNFIWIGMRIFFATHARIVGCDFPRGFFARMTGFYRKSRKAENRFADAEFRTGSCF